MNLNEFPPSSNPSPSQQRDALQKGLGRAVLWARNGSLNDQGVILEACLNDLRHDRQVEHPRGRWLWEIMEATGTVEAFRTPILDALLALDDGSAAQQLCQFCVLYAQHGDERFRARLRDVVAGRPAPDCPWLGEAELVELDREEGLLFAADVRGKSLQDRDWDWDDTGMIDAAVEVLGEPAVASALLQRSTSNADVNRFRQAWLAEVATKPLAPALNHVQAMRQMSLSDIVQKVESKPGPVGILRGWGMHADEDDLRAVLDLLLNRQDPAVIGNYLRVFSNRPMPAFDERLLVLLDHADQQVRERACSALAPNQHPAIRKFAIEHHRRRIAEPGFLKLFIRNCQSGDEDLLLDSLRLPDDPCECHGIVMDLVKLLSANADLPSGGLAIRAYAATPCGACRSDAVEILVARQAAPDWLMEECRWDSVAETRDLVLGALATSDCPRGQE